MGSCAAVSSGVAAEMAHRMALAKAGVSVDDSVQFNYTWLYYHAREMRKWFGQAQGTDTGSYPEDNLTLLMQGAPYVTGQWPQVYVADPTFTPPAEVESAPRADYVMSFRPFYSADGPEALALAFQNNMSVVAAMNWPQEFMQPGGKGNCIMPKGVPLSSSVGGHAIDVIKMYANADGAGLANQWGKGWTQAHEYDPDLSDGDFVLPGEYLWGPNSRVWGFYAVSFEAVHVGPITDDIKGKLLGAAHDVVDMLTATEKSTRAWQKLYNRYKKEGAQQVLDKLTEVANGS